MDDAHHDERIIVYGHMRCAQAAWLAQVLLEQRIPHEWRDVAEGDPGYKDELRALARGHLSVPTVVFPDGTVMVEPMPNEVLTKLNRRPPPGLLQRLLG